MNKKQIIKGFILCGTIVLATFTSCKKDFLDINQNPNAPVNVLAKDLLPKLLPSAQAAIGHAVGNHLQIYGGLWAQYWTQSPASSQYKSFENYNPSADDFDDPWIILYSDALKDIQTIIDKGSAENLPNYVACAMILKAYAFQLLTDNWGDVPFTEALKEEQGILSPHYDSQHDIYHGLADIINEGLATIDEVNVHLAEPADDDLLFHGDMNMWRKFGNTLLLRIYIRLSEKNPVEAEAGVDTLEAHAAEFLGAGEEARIDYFATGGNTNPLYSSIVALQFVQNLVGSKTAVDYMNANADPRVDALYTLSTNGIYEGIPQGAYGLPATTPVSLPGPATGGNINLAASQTAPVKFIAGYESMFLQAEAAERGWLTGAGTAQSLYEAAITESFESFGLTAADATTYYTQASIDYALATDKIEAIITQKWIAMCGTQNDEAWIEWRRTNYPVFFTESVTNNIGAGRFPQRFFYPSIEVTRNANFPGQHVIYDRVWWDVN